MIEVLAHLNATASIRILAWFDDPEALSQLGRGVQQRLLDAVLSIMEELLEFEELRIVEALLDVECERQRVENILILAAIGVIVPHIQEQCFLVVEMLVELKAVIYFLKLPLALLELVLQLSIRH